MVTRVTDEIPEGVSEDARSSWPSRDLIDSFLTDHDLFAWRPGEVVEVDGEAAQAAAREFRDVLGRYCSGVTVVTTVSNDVPIGMTCQSFTSVSLDPPLVAFLPARQSRAFAAIQRSGRFCVNFLADDQEELSNRMASRSEDKFAGLEWTRTENGTARLSGTLGHVDCTVHAVHEAGDHYVVLGRVQEMGFTDDEARQPLLYYRGGYRTLG